MTASAFRLIGASAPEQYQMVDLLTELLANLRRPEERVKLGFTHAKWTLVDDLDGVV